MKNLISKYSYFVIKNPLIILSSVLLVIFIASQGISNFKLDASSDALVLEGDESLKTYRENEKEFGDSSFLIVTFKPEFELFSYQSLNQLSQIEESLSKLDGVDSVLSLLDAPIFFQPKVGLTEVADNLKDLTTEGIDLIKAKQEIIHNPIYRDLIISRDGSTTAMQIVLRGNDEYDSLITDRYRILDTLKSKEPITIETKTILQNELDSILPKNENADLGSGRYEMFGEFNTLDEILNTWNIDGADLLQINIEGDEYSLLDSMIASGSIHKFKNI